LPASCLTGAHKWSHIGFGQMRCGMDFLSSVLLPQQDYIYSLRVTVAIFLVLFVLSHIGCEWHESRYHRKRCHAATNRNFFWVAVLISMIFTTLMLIAPTN